MQVETFLFKFFFFFHRTFESQDFPLLRNLSFHWIYSFLQVRKSLRHSMTVFLGLHNL